MLSQPLPIAEWQTLLAVLAGAAATLTGLVFVAVSINVSNIIAIPGLSSRAAESLLQFLQVFFLCTAILIPGQPSKAAAIEILSLAGLSWVMQVLAQVRYARSRSGHPRWWLITRMMQTQLAGIPLFIGGGCILAGLPAGLYWLMPGFAFSSFAGIANAWVLLIEILR